MVNRSVAKRAKHAKPALRKGYWAKSSSSVLAVALAASLVPAVPALGDEFDADVSDIEATEPRIRCADSHRALVDRSGRARRARGGR